MLLELLEMRQIKDSCYKDSGNLQEWTHRETARSPHSLSLSLHVFHIWEVGRCWDLRYRLEFMHLSQEIPHSHPDPLPDIVHLSNCPGTCGRFTLSWFHILPPVKPAAVKVDVILADVEERSDENTEQGEAFQSLTGILTTHTWGCHFCSISAVKWSHIRDLHQSKHEKTGVFSHLKLKAVTCEEAVMED